MSWWQRLWGGEARPSSSKHHTAVHLAMPGWQEEPYDGHMRVWRNSQGDVLSLEVSEPSLDLPELSDAAALQQMSRNIAQGGNAGLIEVSVTTGALGAAVAFIYKRLQKPAYIFTGMLIVPRQECSLVWTVVSGECGMTGVREAVITSELLSAGELTLEDYERSWAQDPYQPAYAGVERSVLRFVSDNQRYDARFPEHPLSKVRQVLATLPDSVRIESPGSGTRNT